MPIEAPESQTADAVITKIIETMPKPTAPAPAPVPAPVGPKKVDLLGREFDAGKFAVDGTGLPKLDSLGRFIPKGLGRKPRAASVTASAPATTPEPYLPPTAPALAPAPAASSQESIVGPDRYDLAADVYSRAFIALSMGAFGDEWEPDDKAEFIGLKGSVAAYLRATQQEELSPGVALLVSVGTYAAKRVPRPKTQSRLTYLFDRARAWWRGTLISRKVEGV
jgi:hypothetical protein